MGGGKGDESRGGYVLAVPSGFPVTAGLAPPLSGLTSADGSRRLSTSGFPPVRASRDTHFGSSASPVAVTAPVSPVVTRRRHGRTRSGHPRPSAGPAFPFMPRFRNAWMPGTSPGMTTEGAVAEVARTDRPCPPLSPRPCAGVQGHMSGRWHGCSGPRLKATGVRFKMVDRVHDIDSIRFLTFCGVWDTKGDQCHAAPE